MIFTKTPLQGNATLIDIEPYEDFRGIFARTVCYDDFALHGLNTNFVQQSISFNPKVGTLRGMHWQAEPFVEEKLVRVTRGAVFDVIVDIRPASSTFKKWISVELTADNRRQLYIPKGFAHGFQTLLPDTEVHYEMTTRHELDASKGFLWNDPSISIAWPMVENRIIGIRDSSYTDFNDAALNGV
jgi:dTDP-4-dehydrorhamnose 3,5-epimerase